MIEKVCPFHGIPTPEGRCMRKEFNEETGEMEECLAVPKDSTTIYWCKKHRIPIFDKLRDYQRNFNKILTNRINDDEYDVFIELEIKEEEMEQIDLLNI